MIFMDTLSPAFQQALNSGTAVVNGNPITTYTPPSTSTPVPSSTLTTPALNLPQGGTPDNGSAVVAAAVGGTNQANPPPLASQTPGLDSATGDYSKDPAYQASQQALTQNQKDLATAQNQLPSQFDTLTQEQNRTGATADLKTVSDLKTQLAAATAAYNNASAAKETQGIQSGTPAVFYQGEQAAIQRQSAVVTAGLAARLQAAQGNYDMAESLAEKAATLKFADAQQKIDNINQFIKLNQDNLSRSEKLAVSKMQAQAEQKQKVLDQEKAAVSFSLTNNVTKPYYQIGGTIYRTSDGKAYSTPQQFQADGGAIDYSNVQLVTGSASEEKKMVIDLANKYFDAGIKINDSLGTAQQKATKSRLYQEATRFVGGGNNSGPNSTTQLTTVKGQGIVAGQSVPANIAGDVEDVLSGRNTIMNIRLQMGRSNSAAGYLKSIRDAIHKIDPQFDFIASDAGGKLVSSAFYQKSVTAIDSVLPNIDKVVDLSNQVDRLGVAGVDKLLQAGQIQMGNQKVANFHEAQKIIADEIGLALGQGTVSDMKLTLGMDITDPSLSPQVFASNMALVKEFIQNRKKGLEQQRYSSPTAGGQNNSGSQPKQMNLNGKILNLQADGTYQ